jgi:cellulose biosynthesis protein BcsQ
MSGHKDRKRKENPVAAAAAAAFAPADDEDDNAIAGDTQDTSKSTTAAAAAAAASTQSPSTQEAVDDYETENADGTVRTCLIASLLTKGGAGKSTCTRNNADQLASIGFSVLMVDYDSQANLSAGMLDNTSEIDKPERLSAYERARLRREAAAKKERHENGLNEEDEKKEEDEHVKLENGGGDEEQEDEEEEQEDDTFNEFYNAELEPLAANAPSSMAALLPSRARVCRVEMSGQIEPVEDALTQGADTVEVPKENAFNEVMANSILRNLRMGVNSGVNALLKNYETLAENPEWEMAPMVVRAPTHSKEGTVYLLPGDMDLLNYEEVLAGADRTNWLQRNYFLRWMVRFWAKKLGCAFVFFDCAPANSALNGMVLANCDAIMPPAFPDQYSTDSLRALLTRVLPKYIKTKRMTGKEKLDEFIAYAQSDYAANSRYKELVHQPYPRILPVLITNFEACYNTASHSLTMSNRSATWCNRMRDIMQSREVERFSVVWRTPTNNIRPTGEYFERQQLIPDEVQKLLVPFKGAHGNVQHVVALAPSAQIFVAQSHIDQVGMQFVNLTRMASAQDTNESRKERAIAKTYMMHTFARLGECLVDFRRMLLSGNIIQANVTLPPPPPPPPAAGAAGHGGGGGGRRGKGGVRYSRTVNAKHQKR